MTLIKSHSCTKCGGVLIVHNDKQQYECPYCNVFYDYEYFRSRAILEQAAASQKMLQYDSAKEKYEFILKKDPQNFTALRGILLCESGINRPGALSNPEKTVRVIPSSLKDAEEMADDAGKEYFYRLGLLRELATFIRGDIQQKETLEKGVVKIYTRTGCVPLSHSQRAEELAKVRERLDNFNRQFAKLYSQLEELEPDEVKEETKKKASEKETGSDKEKQVFLQSSPTCRSCGGELIVNLNRQVYECPFCGLTFDFDIIRDETALSDVKDAIQKKQYLKADSIYEYILTVDPSNYEALRGRILCAAKCEDLQSIMADPEDCLQKAFIPAIKARIEEALASCKECDRPYFEEFNNAVPELEAFASSSSPSNVHRRKKSSLVRKQNQLEKEYEKAKKEYDVLQSKLPRKNHELAEGLTPKEMIRMHELSDKMCIIRNDINDLQPSIDESEEGVSELDELGIYTIGNIRQHLANLIRLERVRNGEEKAVDLSGFHDAEWEEE